MLAFLLVILGIVSRFFIHAPNFSPLLAIALFSGIYVNKKYSILLPLALMIFTDIFLGFYKAIFFTWVSIIAIAFIGLKTRETKNLKTITLSSLASAVLFFIVTNFGVWLVSGGYEHSLAGLIRCFYLAVPFFRSTLISTVIYSMVLFVAYETLSSRFALNTVKSK